MVPKHNLLMIRDTSFGEECWLALSGSLSWKHLSERKKLQLSDDSIWRISVNRLYMWLAQRAWRNPAFCSWILLSGGGIRRHSIMEAKTVDHRTKTDWTVITTIYAYPPLEEKPAANYILRLIASQCLSALLFVGVPSLPNNLFLWQVRTSESDKRCMANRICC